MSLNAEPEAWLPSAVLLSYTGAPEAGAALQQARLAAAAHVRRVRPDLFLDDAVPTTEDVKLGALMLAARLYARRSTPQGIATFGDFGPGAIMRLDPDVERLLGVGRYAKPQVG